MKNSELIGVWLGADYVFDNGPDRRCVVGSVRLLDKSIVKIRGYASEADLSDNVTYRFYGHNRNHPKYGPQFNFNSFVEEAPVDEESVIAYLETCRKPERGSITKRVALALFEAFGITAIERLIDDPVGVSEAVKQWDAAKAALAARHLESQSGTQRCKLDLITLLNGRGFPKKTIDRAIREWGAAAAKVVRRDPYELTKLPGIGFKGADKLYCDLARETAKTDEEYQEALASLKRQGLCAAYAVSQESRQSGSTWLPIGFAKAQVLANVSRSRANPDAAIDWAVTDGRLVVRDGFCAVARMALHELEIAEFITGSHPGNEWPSIDLIESMAPADKPLSKHQLDAITIALSERLGCLQGSPGCLHGDTRIYDPTDGSNHTVRDRMRQGREFSVIALNSLNSLVIAKANCPNIYPKSEMLRFTFQSGRSVTVTRGHHFWNGNSFVSADSLVGAFSFGEIRLPSISELDLSTHVQDAQSLMKTTEDSPEYCSACCRQYDEQLQCSVVSCQLLPPSQVDAHERTFSFQDRSSRSHHHQVSCHPSTPNCDQQTGLHFACDDQHHFRPGFSEPSSGSSLPESQLYESPYQKNTEIEQSSCVVRPHPGRLSLCVSSSCSKSYCLQGYTGVNGQSLECIVSDRIINIEEVDAEQYFDFHVPIHNNYWSEGCFHHNTGKTFSVSAIVKAIIHKFGHDAIAAAAPCGKAGVKMTQSMRANGVDITASTIHRLLQVEGEGGDGWSFHFNEQNPLPYRFLIIDESSMIDVDLLASLLRACTPSTHVLFVGDTGQLAPVGHGRPFFDLQQVIPAGKLTEILRNSGRIVQACAEIRDRQTITFSPKMDLQAGENLILIQCSDEDQPQVLEQLIAKLDASEIGPRGLSLVDDMQILTGKNDGSPVARKPLNAMLQKILNPDGDQVQGNPFRRGDKIVDLKNGRYPDAEDQNEEHFVANGELAKAVDIKPGRMVVKLTDPNRSILIAHAPVQENERGIDDSENTTKGAVGDWDLGYALSVHRSQGSQWKFTIVMADSKGAMVQSRNWLFTAISRAEIATFVIGQKQVVNAMLKRDGISGRKTFLTERINRMRVGAKIDYENLFADV